MCVSDLNFITVDSLHPLGTLGCLGTLGVPESWNRLPVKWVQIVFGLDWITLRSYFDFFFLPSVLTFPLGVWFAEGGKRGGDGWPPGVKTICQGNELKIHFLGGK